MSHGETTLCRCGHASGIHAGPDGEGPCSDCQCDYFASAKIPAACPVSAEEARKCLCGGEPCIGPERLLPDVSCVRIARAESAFRARVREAVAGLRKSDPDNLLPNRAGDAERAKVRAFNAALDALLARLGIPATEEGGR